jgi:hypothetical protein
MKKFIRKTRLVHACMNLVGGVCRLLGALVDMAFNYRYERDSEVDPPIRGETRAVGLRTV